LAENLCKKQSVKSIDFSRFILPYGSFPLRLIRTDVPSKPPISTLIPSSGPTGATCFYKLVSSCQKMSMSKILCYYYHCRLDLCFSVRFVFMYMKPCFLVIFYRFLEKLAAPLNNRNIGKELPIQILSYPQKTEILSKNHAS